MHKLVIVDDEEIEREGMARFIPWQSYGVQMAGAARNGREALELMERIRPDIVLTDIKMPVMDGIELIERASISHPETVFVVLSGYGDYEYTSRAMELGVRHYVLKPCDEERVMEVIARVQREIDERRARDLERRETEHALNRLLPRARQEALRNVLLGREGAPGVLLLGETDATAQLRVLAVRHDNGFDAMQQAVLSSLLDRFVPRITVLAETSLDLDVVFLLRDSPLRDIEWVTGHLIEEYQLASSAFPRCAVSAPVGAEGLHAAYGEVQDLLRLGGADGSLLSLERLELATDAGTQVFDVAALQASEGIESAFFEIALAFLNMALLGYGQDAMAEAARMALGLAFGVKMDDMDSLEGRSLMAAAFDAAMQADKPWARADAASAELLRACFLEISNPDVSVGLLARTELFMSDGRFSKLFVSCTGERFSSWLGRVRVRLAQRLMARLPDRKVGEIGVAVGFAPDGQYFSKLFRKVVGISPSEYREHRLG